MDTTTTQIAERPLARTDFKDAFIMGDMKGVHGRVFTLGTITAFLTHNKSSRNYHAGWNLVLRNSNKPHLHEQFNIRTEKQGVKVAHQKLVEAQPILTVADIKPVLAEMQETAKKVLPPINELQSKGTFRVSCIRGPGEPCKLERGHDGICDREPTEMEKLKAELTAAKEALEAMYDLRGGMEKPGEHKATADAFRKVEAVLFGRSYTPPFVDHTEGR